MKKHYIMRVLLFSSIFLLGFSQLYANDEKIDKEMCQKAIEDSAYLWIRNAIQQASFIGKESKKMSNIDMLITIADSQKNMHKLAQYRTRKQLIMDNIERTLISYSESIQEIAMLPSKAVEIAFPRYLDFIRNGSNTEQGRILANVQKHIEGYRKDKRVNAKQWKEDLAL